MRLIGLNARLHGGKDTAYETIGQEAEARSMLAIRRAFADPLKVSGMRALGFGGAEVETDKEAAIRDAFIVAIANQIKETGRITTTWTDDLGTLQSKSITGRQLWQLYGTEAHRADDLGSSFGMDFWVDNLLPLGDHETDLPGADNGTRAWPLFWDNFKEDWAGYADIAVVTDVRFPNEAKRILALDGEVWQIDAEERLGPNPDAHPSEQPLADEFVTRVIDNNSTLAAFQQNILDALHS